ncbi:histidine phosphatase family protein [Lichenibacterium ramalinae]|uniref:Histidine phosphatase family protein n=1 Tax=Lichenibacterium ramalinae TaxID=2316527 RepID=A0A4Q2RCW7_9HYPH|nr:histidine phosphatase family protein [Lichenibacterium ramalinae]RYB03012.1 histidine phosphatase family protein [Lichenibacterium ramalinae]
MLTLLLVRHASHGLLGRVLAGRMAGVVLSAEGRAEAERLAEALAGRGIARILSSPLERTRETAAIVAARAGVAVETAEEINEIDCGAWTGADFAKLPDDPLWQRWNSERATCAMPDGEGMAAVQARALGLVGRLAATDRDETVALVTHSDVVKAVVMAALGLSLDRHDHLVVDPASVTTLHVYGDYMRVVRLNEVAA